jgi:hypothetical protein
VILDEEEGPSNPSEKRVESIMQTLKSGVQQLTNLMGVFTSRFLFEWISFYV